MRSPASPLLWAVAGSNADLITTTSGDPLVVLGLTPATRAALNVATVDPAGVILKQAFVATTLPAEPHVVINEVLAHPLGPKPAEEWVELVNDGTVSADLTGYVLMVADTATPSPLAASPPKPSPSL